MAAIINLDARKDWRVTQAEHDRLNAETCAKITADQRRIGISEAQIASDARAITKFLGQTMRPMFVKGDTK